MKKEVINLKESRGLGWGGTWEGLEGRKWEMEIIILKSQKLKEVTNYIYVYLKSIERLCEGG